MYMIDNAHKRLEDDQKKKRGKLRSQVNLQTRQTWLNSRFICRAEEYRPFFQTGKFQFGKQYLLNIWR